MSTLALQKIGRPIPVDPFKSYASYRAIFDAAVDAIFVHDPKTGQILDANLQACDICGWTLDQLRKINVNDLSSDAPSRSEPVVTLLQKAATSSQAAEWCVKQKSGQLLWVEANLKRASLNNREVMLVFLRDISRRKDLMESLRQSETRFQKAFSANPQPMSLTTIADGRYMDVNESFLATSGYGRDEVVGRTALELNIWETPARREEFIKELRAAGSLRNFEMLFRTRDNRFRVFLSSAEQLEIEGEKCVLVASNDITDLRIAENAAKQSLCDLGGKLIQAQEDERRRVARELHDDLSQKMALLSIELDYIHHHASMGEDELRSMTRNLVTDADDISEDIHRISHQLHPSKLDQLGLVKAVKSFTKEFSEHYELKIDFTENGFPARLPADVRLCAFRIIQEALRNVVKHSGADKASVTVDRKDHTLRLCVSDSGHGFDTLSDSMTAGLGFVGMRERLRSVGGKLSIFSAPEWGTRIEAFIPLANKAEKEVVGRGVLETPKGDARVLLIRPLTLTEETVEGL